MKKIIDGKVYDTTTARLVGTWEAACGRREFAWYSEALYQKRTGEYFLHGDGNATSPYRRKIDINEWRGGEGIKPLTVEEARTWAEEHLTADAYESEFGEIAEDDSRTVLSITMAASLAEQLRREAAKAGASLSAYIEGKLQS